MWLEQIIRRETGCATYLVGSTETGECVAFDPLWDPTPYLLCAKRQSSRITGVIDSHSHADHVSGARRLVAATGAQLLMPALAEVEYPCSRVSGGDQLEMGELLLEFIPAPGHRPEQLCLLITDRSRSDDPWCMLTADFVLVGDVARPDLAQDGTEGAQTLFSESLPRFREFPPFVEVYPGHVSGST